MSRSCCRLHEQAEFAIPQGVREITAREEVNHLASGDRIFSPAVLHCCAVDAVFLADHQLRRCMFCTHPHLPICNLRLLVAVSMEEVYLTCTALSTQNILPGKIICNS